MKRKRRKREDNKILKTLIIKEKENLKLKRNNEECMNLILNNKQIRKIKQG